MELASITAIFESLKAATDLAMVIKQSDVGLEKAETKLKLAELITSLAEARIKVAEVQAVILEKDEQIRKMAAEASVAASVKYESPCYWREADGKKDGPFCQKCFDIDKKLVRLQGHGDGYWECRACKSIFTTKEYDRRQRINYPDHDPYV